VYHLFVSEKHQNKGIATELWLKLVDVCRTTQYTVRSSLYAVPFYEKHGFIKTSTIETKDSLQFQSMELLTPYNK